MQKVVVVGELLGFFFSTALPQNNHTETILIKSLLAPLALASYWLTLTYVFNSFILICVLPQDCDLSGKVLMSVSGGSYMASP